MKQRLSKHDWLQHGLRALAGSGHEGLKADLLARSLQVSRGSFYWHFKNLHDFHVALLAYWKEHTTERTIAELNTHVEDAGRLTEIMLRSFASDDRLEQAMRRWAVQNRSVKRAVAGVDKVRIDYLTTLLVNVGVPTTVAGARAAFIYAASLGRSQIDKNTISELTPQELEKIAELMQQI
ncbi:MAG: TetR/AcrR family transcriptional regulator [Pseudomonadota bacterium]